WRIGCTARPPIGVNMLPSAPRGYSSTRTAVRDTTKAGHGHGRGQRTARAARGPGSSAPERASRRGLSVARPAPGAERTVAVLELMAAHPDERFTLSEVARRCGLNKATAHALLSALTARGVLVRHPDEKRYSLGPRLVAIG